ncbi:MAG TPA: MarR family transcriptional regulator [Deltaproteobacteria bacterium]|nr:MarR family transcriptional regulator [Deltaproteobacteria bacterium]
MPSKEDSILRAISTLQRLSELFDARREQVAREAGLTVREWGVLEEIATEHFMPSLFAARRSVTPPAISKLLRGLLERGLIRASVAEGDRRQRRYVLTTAGRRILEGIRRERQRAIERVWARLPGAELRRFARFGQDLADRLEDLLDRERPSPE